MTTTACGSEDLGAVGQCDVSGLTDDPQLETVPKGFTTSCTPDLSTFCADVEGIKCLESKGDDYTSWAIVVTGAAGWQAVASLWSTESGCIAPTPPTGWDDASMVMAGINARNACDASASIQVQADSKGRPHAEITLDYDYDGSDCLAFAVTGVVIRSTSAPTTCMRVSSY